MVNALNTLTFASLLIFLAAKSSFACSCIRSSVEEEFQNADAVFLGRVVSVGGLWSSGGAKFRVERSWKGVDVDEVTVHTVPNTCGFSFEEGEAYVIFGGRSPEGKLGTWACSNSTNVKYDHTTKVLSYLENKETISLASAPASYGTVGLITVLSVSLFIIIGILVKNYSRRAV
jgi:hypothetical protein